MTEHYGSINLDDGQIRFYPAERLSDEDYQATKTAGLNWKRGQQCFMGPWSTWKVDFLAKHFGITQLEDDNTDLVTTAEARAEYYGAWGGNAARRSKGHSDTVDGITRYIPLGQPILAGHHSERRARRDQEKIWSNTQKSIDEGKRAAYWKGKATRTVAAAERRYKPGPIYRRIEKIKAMLRKSQRSADHELWLAKGYGEWAIHDGKDPEVVWALQETRANREIEFYTAYLAYQQALYEASGGIVAESLVFEVGGACQSWAGLCEILKVNKKSVRVQRMEGTRALWAQTITKDKISRAFSKAEYQAVLEKYKE